MTFLTRMAGLLLALLWTSSVQAGMLDETCGTVYEKLGSGPYGSLTKSIQGFSFDGNPHRGCVIHLSADARSVADTQRPHALFGRALPYCPGGRLPGDRPGAILNEDGWCADRMADGPDGTFYMVIKEDVFCIVEGSWDGGDDGDSSYVQSPRYEVIVKCSNRQR